MIQYTSKFFSMVSGHEMQGPVVTAPNAAQAKKQANAWQQRAGFNYSHPRTEVRAVARVDKDGEVIEMLVRIRNAADFD